MSEQYTVERARELGWVSLGGSLAPYRVEALDKYVVGTNVLDAGCGGGGYVDYLARKGMSAVGVDAHDNILSVAGELGFQGTFLLADLNRTLPFADGTFDTSYCFDVLEHIDDVTALRELARVTTRRIILTVPREDSAVIPYGFRLPPYADPTHLRYYTRQSVELLIETLAPQSFEIYDECPTNIELLARHRLRIKSRYPLLTPIYQRLFTFLINRCYADEFYFNFLVVVDLSQS